MTRINLDDVADLKNELRTMDDVAKSRKVAGIIMSWCYPANDDVTREMLCFTTGYQAGMITRLLDRIEELLRPRT